MTQRDELSIERLLCCPLTQVENVHGWRSRVLERKTEVEKRSKRKWTLDQVNLHRRKGNLSMFRPRVFGLTLPRGMQDSRSTFSFPLLPCFPLPLPLSPLHHQFHFSIWLFSLPPPSLFQRQCNILTMHSTVRKWLLETVKDALIHGFSTRWSRWIETILERRGYCDCCFIIFLYFTRVILVYKD